MNKNYFGSDINNFDAEDYEADACETLYQSDAIPEDAYAEDSSDVAQYEAEGKLNNKIAELLLNHYDEFEPDEDEYEYKMSLRRKSARYNPDDYDYDEYGNPIEDDIYTEDDMYWDERYHVDTVLDFLQRQPFEAEADRVLAMHEGEQHINDAYLEDEVEELEQIVVDNSETIDQQNSDSKEEIREVLILAPIQKLTEHGWQNVNAVGNNQILFCDRTDFFADRDILVSIYEAKSWDNGAYCSGVLESMYARFNLVRVFSNDKYHYLWLQDEELVELLNDYEKALIEYPVPNGVCKKYIEDTFNTESEICFCVENMRYC